MKWFLVILAVLVSMAVGIYVLDVANVIDVKTIAVTSLTKWSVASPYIEAYRLGLAEDTLLQERKDQLDQMASELATREQDLLAKQELLNKREQELNSLAKKIENEKLALENQRQEFLAEKSDAESLKVEARLLSEMEIESILAILESLPENKQVSLMSNMDQDTITTLLEKMEPRKAAQLLSQVSKRLEGR